MVASHCTSAWATVNGDLLDVNWSGGDNGGLATETYDPNPSQRHSDMAMFLVNSGKTAQRGLIARTALGSTTIDESGPPLNVVYTSTSTVNGNYVQKTGVTTGRTDGYINLPCGDITESGHTVYCQVRAGYTLDAGDSGGPVYYPENADAVDFLGVNHSKQSYQCGPLVWCSAGWYSPVTGIYSDMGATASQFTFTSGITVSAPTLSGSVAYSPSCGFTAPALTWTGSTVSGTTWPVQYKIYGQDYYGGGSYSSQYLVATVGAGTTSYTPCQPASTYFGASPPGNDESYTVFFVVAYDSGVQAYSLLKYFQ
jgi:hypothetical protein